jgi:hypothetical protein
MFTTLTTGTAVTCTDQAGNVVHGIIADIELGECRGGGMAMVKAVWPGRKAKSLRAVELADVAVSA